MNSRHTVSRSVWLALVTSGVLAVLAWTALWRWRSVAPAPASEFATLIAERERLRGNEDVVRDTLRAQRDALRGRAWTAERIARLKSEIGSGWQWTSERPDRALLRRGALLLDEWPHCLELISALSARPGVMIESLEVQAIGARHERAFVGVRVGLRFIVSDAPSGDAERAAPSRGPLPVAPAESPAESRKLGRGPALRRPAASAKPPVGWPASASFRARPSGFQGRAIQTITQPQQKL